MLQRGGRWPRTSGWSVASLRNRPTNVCQTLFHFSASGIINVGCRSSDAFFFFKEIKEELEHLNKEIKKTANKIRGKLKCEFKVSVLFSQ